MLRQRFAELPSSLAMASLDRPQPGRRAVLKRALGVAALVPAAWLLSRQLPIDVWRADLHTATGERKQLPLADGSALQLNTASAVDVDLARRRLTLLDGEMALSVPGAAALTVHTRYGQVIASQAEVCVRQLADACRVSVLKGQVQVLDMHGRITVMHAGQQARLEALGLAAPSPFDVLQLGWRDGVLTAQNQLLGDFCASLIAIARVSCAGTRAWKPCGSPAVSAWTTPIASSACWPPPMGCRCSCARVIGSRWHRAKPSVEVGPL